MVTGNCASAPCRTDKDCRRLNGPEHHTAEMMICGGENHQLIRSNNVATLVNILYKADPYYSKSAVYNDVALKLQKSIRMEPMFLFASFLQAQ
jgi:hypothetical protein